MAEYITKEQVIDWFSPYGHFDKPIPFETLVSDLRVMKSAEVAPVRHGKWIKRKSWDFHVCSECSFEKSPSNYCPNCGAKME